VIGLINISKTLLAKTLDSKKKPKAKALDSKKILKLKLWIPIFSLFTQPLRNEDLITSKTFEQNLTLDLQVFF